MIDVSAKKALRATGEEADILKAESTEAEGRKEYWIEMESGAKYFLYRRGFHADGHWVVSNGWPILDKSDGSDFYTPFKGMDR